MMDGQMMDCGRMKDGWLVDGQMIDGWWTDEGWTDEGWGVPDACTCVHACPPVRVTETHCVSVLLLRRPSRTCALTQYTPPACRAGMCSSVCSGGSVNTSAWRQRSSANGGSREEKRNSEGEKKSPAAPRHAAMQLP